jgi:excinuclease ABC subunit B
MGKFRLSSPFKPTGDQPSAIKKIVTQLRASKNFLTLMGATGSGKTFTLACAIAEVNRPVLVISHNKTLAGQLYAEFKEFFPSNAIEYFVSYYDYYQPESYIPQTDTYIEKDASINERLDRLRLSATSSLSSRRDVIVVASVSCIYNLGSPDDYQNLTFSLKLGQALAMEDVLRELIQIQYERNDLEFKRGGIRVRGDVIDIFPSYKEKAVRIEFFSDTVEKMYEFDPVSGKKISDFEKINIYPAKHFIIEKNKIQAGVKTIYAELKEQLSFLKSSGKLLEAQRLEQRTRFDMEMLQEYGYCHGIENYSRHLSARAAGLRPYCLIDYFDDDFITIIDESHVTLPQIRGMYQGDKSRKQTLVDYGFRLPSCLDNRPLRYDEFAKLTKQTIFVSATPSEFEIQNSNYKLIEQIIRPTGLPDPEIFIKAKKNQISEIVKAIGIRAQKNERCLVTTLTKKMSEELARYLKEAGLKVRYLHSEINTIERVKIIKDLRTKKIDAIIGVNLLREGLDLPEVSLVAILDADKEGFLRSATSLIQVAGRSARHINGQVYMYADKITPSMKKAISESRRRRKIQLVYNKEHGITPKGIEKAVKEGIEIYFKEEKSLRDRLELNTKEIELHEAIAQLEKEMYLAAKSLHFEKAAALRDKSEELKKALSNEYQKNNNR